MCFLLLASRRRVGADAEPPEGELQTLLLEVQRASYNSYY